MNIWLKTDWSPNKKKPNRLEKNIVMKNGVTHYSDPLFK